MSDYGSTRGVEVQIGTDDDEREECFFRRNWFIMMMFFISLIYISGMIAILIMICLYDTVNTMVYVFYAVNLFFALIRFATEVSALNMKVDAPERGSVMLSAYLLTGFIGLWLTVGHSDFDKNGEYDWMNVGYIVTIIFNIVRLIFSIFCIIGVVRHDGRRGDNECLRVNFRCPVAGN